MKRRPAGVLLILAVTVVTLVVAGAVNRTRPGLAVAAPPPGPPTPGLCLTSPITGLDRMAVIPPGVTSTFGPCTGSRFGEVAGVWTDGLPALVGSPEAATTPVEPATMTRCEQTASAYVGVPAAATSGLWQSPVSLTTSLVGPSHRQTAAGQRWLACVVGLGGSPLSGSLRDAMAKPAVARQLTQCVPTPNWSERRVVDCSTLHLAEVLGELETGDQPGLTEVRLESTCRVLAAAVTRMPDLDQGGLLQVETVAWHYGEGGEPVSGFDATHYGHAQCIIKARFPRKLGGSLTALGSGPVPWA